MNSGFPQGLTHTLGTSLCNIIFGYFCSFLKQHKPWFDEEYLDFLDQRKQAKMQWVQEASQSNVDNLNNVRCEASRHSRNKKKEYLKAKIDELETKSIKNIRNLYRGINDFKKGYQPRINTVKNEKSDLVADSHSILARWWNHFSQLFSILRVSDVRQTETHIAEPLMHETSTFEAELAIEKLKSHKSACIVQIPAEQFAMNSINLLFLFGIRRNC